jgi:hypothetical protein
MNHFFKLNFLQKIKNHENNCQTQNEHSSRIELQNL